ncbi:MAG: hypothetical protein NC117_09420 [Pseudoflavonifractor sp.]|nr:hypothetical protein [Pseudoflavonifractor sp.]
MRQDNDILNRAARRSGMTVPEGYFEDFARRMADSLPDREAKVLEFKPSLWQRVSPYVYMAAMFAGVWCMLHMFGLMRAGTDLSIDNNPMLAKAVTNDSFMEEYFPVDDISDYDLLQEMYESGVDAEEITGDSVTEVL